MSETHKTYFWLSYMDYPMIVMILCYICYLLVIDQKVPFRQFGIKRMVCLPITKLKMAYKAGKETPIKYTAPGPKEARFQDCAQEDFPFLTGRSEASISF